MPTKKVTKAAAPKAEKNPGGRPRNPEAFPNRLAALSVGESEARVVRLAGAKATSVVIAKTLTDMRNIVNKQAATAADRSGKSFTITQGDFRTFDGDIVCAVVVSCSGEA